MKNLILSLFVTVGLIGSALAQQTNSYFTFSTTILETDFPPNPTNSQLTILNRTGRSLDFRMVIWGGGISYKLNDEVLPDSTPPGQNFPYHPYVGEAYMISDTINFETLGFIKFLKAGNQTITLFENSGNLFLSNSESTISGRLMSETNVLTDPILVTDLATNPIFIDALAKALTATNKLTALATNPIFLNALAKALTTTNNTNYNIASKLNQTISFSSIPIQTYKFGKTIAFTATSSSKLPVVYSCENTSIGIIHDNILLLQGSGTTTITASQVGSQYYNPASATKPLIVK